jgi:TonB-dependent SusC/RagA subfamily outer membrane receptor
MACTKFFKAAIAIVILIIAISVSEAQSQSQSFSFNYPQKTRLLTLLQELLSKGVAINYEQSLVDTVMVTGICDQCRVEEVFEEFLRETTLKSKKAGEQFTIYADGNGKIIGRVIDTGSGAPLVHANVYIPGSSFGDATNLLGNFTLYDVPPGEYTVIARHIGYKEDSVHVEVTAGKTVIFNSKLSFEVFQSDTILVVGLRKSVDQTASWIPASTKPAVIVPPDSSVAAIKTVGDILQAKVPGLTVGQNSGAPGSGFGLNLRGVSGLYGSANPLIIMNGVPVSNAVFELDPNPTNRLIDVNPHDIESIDVFKGPSAPAMFDSRASDGVIVIKTKRGKVGSPSVNLTQRFGFSKLLRKIGSRRFTEETAYERYGQEGLDKFRASGGKFLDYEKAFYGETGLEHLTSVDLSGGSQKFRYYGSGLFQNDQGIVKHTGQNRFNGRLNLDYYRSEETGLSASLSFLDVTANRSLTGNWLEPYAALSGIDYMRNPSLTRAVALTPSFLPFGDVPLDLLELDNSSGIVYSNRIYQGQELNPFFVRDSLGQSEDIKHLTASAGVSHHIMNNQRQNLSIDFRGGIDWLLQTGEGGDIVDAQIRNTSYNFGMGLKHDYSFNSRTMATTVLGIQYEQREIEVKWLPEVYGLSDTFQSKQFSDRNHRIFGFYLQSEFNLFNYMLASAGVRGESNSLENSKIFLYPKLSGTLQLFGNAFFEEPISETTANLHISYGEAGNLPELIYPRMPKFPFGFFTVMNDLKPEKTREMQLGLDFRFASNRGSIELMHYRKYLSNLIFSLVGAPAIPVFLPGTFRSNWSGNDYLGQGGNMLTTGWELSFDVVPIESRAFSWRSVVGFFASQSKITRWGTPFGLGRGIDVGYDISVGSSPTTIVEYVWQSGSDPLSEPTVKKIVLGNETPDFQMSFVHQLKFKEFVLDFSWDWKQGGDVYNLGMYLMDIAGTSPDYDEMITSYEEDENGAVIERKKRRGESRGNYVEDGSYVKLRELSLTYSLPISTVRKLSADRLSYLKLGLSGRNLLVFTKYSGYDPELSDYSYARIGRSIDSFPYPSSRSFYVSLSTGF